MLMLSSVLPLLTRQPRLHEDATAVASSMHRTRTVSKRWKRHKTSHKSPYLKLVQTRQAITGNLQSILVTVAALTVHAGTFRSVEHQERFCGPFRRHCFTGRLMRSQLGVCAACSC